MAPGFFRISANFPCDKLKIVCDGIIDICQQNGIEVENKEIQTPKSDFVRYKLSNYEKVNLPIYREIQSLNSEREVMSKL